MMVLLLLTQHLCKCMCSVVDLAMCQSDCAQDSKPWVAMKEEITCFDHNYMSWEKKKKQLQQNRFQEKIKN